MLALVIIQTIVVVLLAAVVVSLLRSHADVLRRLHDAGLDGPEESTDSVAPDDIRTRSGVPAPTTGTRSAGSITGHRPSGAAATIDPGLGSTPTLLAFLSSGCTTCGEFWDALRDPLELPGDARLVVVTGASDREDPPAVARLAPAWATTVMSTEAWDDYAVPASPYFILVGPGGSVLGEGAALNWEQLRTLLARAVESSGVRTGRRTTARRIEDTDAELLAAGITPNDPSLYPEPGPERT
ncbi:MAG: hypothetical protein ACXIVQ_07280 [Acidimicrobiales bacterium]